MNKYSYSIKYQDKNSMGICLTYMHEYGNLEAEALELISERINHSSFIGKVLELKLVELKLLDLEMLHTQNEIERI